MKKLYVALFTLIAVALAGCGDASVKSVKNGHLFDRQETTVGDAIGAAFNEPKWTSKESENKAKYVIFTGTTKQELPYLDIGAYLFKVPKNSPVTITFLVDGDSTFKITSAESALEPYAPPLTIEGCTEGECRDYDHAAWMYQNFIAQFSVDTGTEGGFNLSSHGVQPLSEQGIEHLMLAIYGRK